MTFKHLYNRIKYRKELKQGFALLDSKNKVEFVIVDSRAFIMNGKDPMVKVDLTTGKAEQYQPIADGLTYIYKITPWTPDD